jgi:hypothetical protein
MALRPNAQGAAAPGGRMSGGCRRKRQRSALRQVGGEISLGIRRRTPPASMVMAPGSVGRAL